jgi:hypothetical protein
LVHVPEEVLRGGVALIRRLRVQLDRLAVVLRNAAAFLEGEESSADGADAAARAAVVAPAALQVAELIKIPIFITSQMLEQAKYGDPR